MTAHYRPAGLLMSRCGISNPTRSTSVESEATCLLCQMVLTLVPVQEPRR